MSRASLLRELATSAEHEHLRRLDDAVAWAAAQRAAGERPRNIAAPAGSDERPVEIPWCLARYAGERRVLDVGYAFAEPAYLAGPARPRRAGADRRRPRPGGGAGAHERPGRPARPAVRGRRLRLRDRDLDPRARRAGQHAVRARLPKAGDSLDAALRELRRVCARLLVTVPTGAGELLPEQAVHAPGDWIDRFEQAGLVVWEDELYELGDDGWRSVPALSPGLRYGERGPGASAVLCAELRPTVALGDGAARGARPALPRRAPRHRLTPLPQRGPRGSGAVPSFPREDHSLRRRRAPPAPGDPPGQGARPARGRGRPQPRGARASPRRTSRRSSTSPTRPP